MKKLAFVIALIFTALPVFAQGSAGRDAKFEYRSLVDMPTAGILEKGFVGQTTDVLPYGVVIAKLEVGVFTNVSFGISYGGANIIGSGKIDWYKLPGVNFRVRLLNESDAIPALTIGFDSQGKGQYVDSSSRYQIKSPGFFAATSKNFALLGYMSLHGTINYSLESNDGDDFVNMMIGIEKTIGPSVSIICEYNFAWNDNKQHGNFGNGNGYLNAGIRWAIGTGFTLGVDLRDLLNNKKLNPSSADRAIRLEYIKSIF
jgi:hypothetical protein